jgi:glutaredoxin
MEFTADIQILSTPGCAGCDDVKRAVTTALDDYPDQTWEEIDLVEHPEIAGRFGIMTVPAVVIGGEVVFTGIPRRAKLEAALAAHVRKEDT